VHRAHRLLSRVDPNLARIEAEQHAILADSYRLIDLNSTNRTQVNIAS